MFANFDYVKHPNKWFEEHKEYYDKICMESEKKRKKLKLVKDGRFVYAASPFQSFVGDCESCSHYMRSPYDFVEGGDCLLHHVSVGYGFICKDNDSEENIGWKEFERIKHEST